MVLKLIKDFIDHVFSSIFTYKKHIKLGFIVLQMVERLLWQIKSVWIGLEKR